MILSKKNITATEVLIQLLSYNVVSKVLGKLPPSLILTLILNQTLTLTGGAIFLGGNFPNTVSKHKNKNENTEFHDMFISVKITSTQNKESRFSPVWVMEFSIISCLS